METYNTYDMQQNKDKVKPGSKWFPRGARTKIVTVLKVEGGSITIKTTKAPSHSKKQKPIEKKLSLYGFLQVYKPVSGNG